MPPSAPIANRRRVGTLPTGDATPDRVGVGGVLGEVPNRRHRRRRSLGRTAVGAAVLDVFQRPRMIRVVYRLRVPEGAEATFPRAWRHALEAIRRRAPEVVGAELLRSHADPREFQLVTRWTSVEAWRAFWAAGPAEPQGDPARNEVLVEVDAIDGEEVR